MTRLYASLKELDRDLKDGKFSPVYFFYGENDFLIREYEERLSGAALAGGGLFGELLCSVFYAGDNTATEVLNAAMTIPMGGARKVIVLRGAEKLKAKEADAIVTYAKDPSPRTILLIVARGIGKGKWVSGIAAPPGDKLTEIAKQSATVFFAKAREVDVREWVIKRFQAEGKEIDHEALDVIIDFIGQDLSAVSMEVEKLLIYLGEAGRASLSDVEEVLPYLRVHTVFELTDALSRGDLAASVEMLREVMSEGAEYTQVLSTIRWHFMRLWTLKVMLDEGVQEGTISRDLRIPSFRLAEYVSQAHRIPHEILRRVFREFYKTDRLLKSRSGKGTVVMDKMVQDITAMMRTGRYTSA